jgi:hypothetical protein
MEGSQLVDAQILLPWPVGDEGAIVQLFRAELVAWGSSGFRDSSRLSLSCSSFSCQTRGNPPFTYPGRETGRGHEDSKVVVVGL